MSASTFDQLVSYEQKFRQSPTVNKVSYKLTPATLVSSDGSASVEVVRCRRADGKAEYFYDKAISKARIVLHFTVGNLRSDVWTLTGDKKLSVPFVVARDGTIYELFDSTRWSYHLGANSKYDNVAMSAVSVGIEVSNYGPLTLSGSVLKNAYGSVYCTLAQTEAYTKLASPYRGYQYFSSYTPQQVNAVVNLIDYLCAQHSIPKTLLPEAQRHEVLGDLSKSGVGTEFLGICSHVNFRPDKFDLGPAFAWSDLAEALEEPVSFGFVEELPSAEQRMLGLELPLEGEDAESQDDPHDRHEVQEGDTLTSIAALYQTTVPALVALNELAEPNLLEVGQVLRLPASGRIWLVEEGDTLSEIAAQAGVPVEAIMYANDLVDPHVIVVGQRLAIPR